VSADRPHSGVPQGSGVRDAVVVNVARGRVIDTPEFVEALGSDTIRDAALDVTHPEPLPGNHPLWRPANRLITPHAGGHAPRHWDRLADIVAENTDRLESGTELLGEVHASANQAITADPRPRSAGVV
jgi:phosphoglycerate dehydrogenase-like enzyme